VKVQVRLINDNKSNDEVKESVTTGRIDIENADRIYKYLKTILKKEDDKYTQYYENGRRYGN